MVLVPSLGQFPAFSWGATVATYSHQGLMQMPGHAVSETGRVEHLVERIESQELGEALELCFALSLREGAGIT